MDTRHVCLLETDGRMVITCWGGAWEVRREGWSVGTGLGRKVCCVLPYGTCKMETAISVKVSPKIARRTDVIVSLQRNNRL